MTPRHYDESGYATHRTAIAISGVRPYVLLAAIHGDDPSLPRVRTTRPRGRQSCVSLVDAMALARHVEGGRS